MNKSVKNDKFVDYSYIIKEMFDDMTQSVENIATIITKQNKLLGYLDAANDEDYKALSDEMKNSNKKYESQIKILEHRIDCAKKVIDEIDNPEIVRLISLLLEAFGVANNEAKTIEERESNHEDITSIDELTNIA